MLLILVCMSYENENGQHNFSFRGWGLTHARTGCVRYVLDACCDILQADWCIIFKFTWQICDGPIAKITV